MKTQTYATEAAAKKAAASAYGPAVVRLPNGRYSLAHPGHSLPRGARTVSRWYHDRWRAPRK